MLFRQTIHKHKKYIYWVDRYFGIDTLEFLMDGIDKNDVKEVKLLASVFQDGITKDLYEKFRNFCDEMENQNIVCQLKVITDKDLHYEIHDRIIEGKNIVHNIPSAKQVNLGQYSEIKKTHNRPPFMEWWNKSGNLDLIVDWNKIESENLQLRKRKTYPATCIVCGKHTDVPFAPDGIRPIYCDEHLYLK